MHTLDRRRIAAGMLGVIAVAVLAWPFRSVEPAASVDWDWVATLSYAAHNHLPFGDRIVWSFGPLGFLETWFGPVLYDGDVLLISWLFAALVQLLLAATLLAALRRWLPLAAAALLAFVVLVLAPDRLVALGFAWCALVLTREDARGRIDAAFPFALGAVVGIALLGKLNQGLELLLLGLIAIGTNGSRRDAASFAGALLAAAALGWVATGQRIADVWPYLRYGAEIVTGYANAMGSEQSHDAWTFAGALAITLCALAAAWGSTVRPSRRWGLLALIVVYAGFGFKEGFVRQDAGHMETFFGGMLVPFAVLLPTARSRRVLQLACVAGAVLSLVVLLGQQVVASRLNPYANVTAVTDQLRTLASPVRRDALASELRAEIASTWVVQSDLVNAVGDRTVMFLPYVYGDIAWAYGLNLRPLPTLEPYAAYTPTLDRLDAQMLRSARAPERILRAHIAAIDSHVSTFEAPTAMVTILCRYREVTNEGPWQLLARSADRCAAARAFRTVVAHWGAPVAVPSPRRRDTLVLVRIAGTAPRGLESLRSLLVRPRWRWIVLDGARYRFAPAIAPDGFLLRAPRALDYRRPFAMADNPSRIVIERDGGEPQGTLHLTFVEVPIRPFATAATSR